MLKVMWVLWVSVWVVAGGVARAEEIPPQAEAVQGGTPVVSEPEVPVCPKGPLKRWRRIVIDPGHGGINEGALGVANMYEKHLTLAVAQHLVDRMEACFPEVEVLLTRADDTDLGLQARAQFANDVKADLLLSLHFNSASNLEASGHETFWLADTRPVPPEGPLQHTLWGALADLPARGSARVEAAAVSAAVARQLHEAIKTHLPKSFDRGVKRANFAVLRHADIPALVIEMGFLSHADEGRSVVVPDFQARWASAILSALAASDAAPDPSSSALTLALPSPSNVQ